MPPVDAQLALMLFGVWTDEIGAGEAAPAKLYDTMITCLRLGGFEATHLLQTMVRIGLLRDEPGHIGPHGWVDRMLYLTPAGVAARARVALHPSRVARLRNQRSAISDQQSAPPLAPEPRHA